MGRDRGKGLYNDSKGSSTGRRSRDVAVCLDDIDNIPYSQASIIQKTTQISNFPMSHI
jgi:hypothetical protein